MKVQIILLLTTAISVCQCAPSDIKDQVDVRKTFVHGKRRFVGGVYAMSNNIDENTIIAYGRQSDGMLEPIGEFKTGGKGAVLDDLDGVDPLFAAYSIIITPDNRFILAVNAGSNSISVFKIKQDSTLHLVNVTKIDGFGPNSIAYSNGIVYVSSIDADGEFDVLPAQRGSLAGFRLFSNGRLIELPGSKRLLLNRPATIQFSPDGGSLVVSAVLAGHPALNNSKVNEIVVYRVLNNGRLSRREVSSTTSTRRNNLQGRHLPTAIGFQIVSVGKQQVLAVTEARVQDPTGEIDSFQTSSVSTWRLTKNSQLIPIQLDTLVGSSFTEGQQATCWIVFSKSREYFWVSNTASSTLSSFKLNGGKIKIVEDVAASGGQNPIDLWGSADGKYIYQLFSGSVGAFEVSNHGLGAGLKLIQSVSGIPEQNAQGIVAF